MVCAADNVQSILTWFHSCSLFRFGRSDCGLTSVVLSVSWLVCMKLSLARLFSSPWSVMLGGTDGKSAVDTSDGPTLLASLSAFCCCSSSSVCSTGKASKMFSTAVGRIARTVNVQSSWFCSNRRRRLEIPRECECIHHRTCQLTSPSQCAHRSSAAWSPSLSPAHTAKLDSQHRGLQRQRRSLCGCDETIAWPKQSSFDQLPYHQLIVFGDRQVIVSKKVTKVSVYRYPRFLTWLAGCRTRETPAKELGVAVFLSFANSLPFSD